MRQDNLTLISFCFKCWVEFALFCVKSAASWLPPKDDSLSSIKSKEYYLLYLYVPEALTQIKPSYTQYHRNTLEYSSYMKQLL